MEQNLWEEIERRLKSLKGKIGFYYYDCTSGDERSFQENEPMMAASVIKTFIMAEAFHQMEQGLHTREELYTVRRADCVPSCGAIRYMHDGLEVTLEDLYTLMIILSDNSATNYMIDILGEEKINAFIRELGFSITILNRKMYDEEKSSRGIQNYITAKEVGLLLRKIYDGTLVNKEASEDMLRILADQRLNSKIPFIIHALPDAPRIAHKTGEDTGITHDVGIVLGEKPFVVAFCGNETDVPVYEREIAEISMLLYEDSMKR